MTWAYSSYIVFSYFVGAIPFGYLIGKIFYHTDIRRVGSKNPGATNVWRTLGKTPGLITLALDILKGLGPVLLVKKLFPMSEGLALLCALAAVVGHNWTIFLKGKGGKGVATSAGVFLALIPKQAGLAILTFLIVFALFRYVSLGSIMAAVALSVSAFVFDTTRLIQIFVLVASLSVLLRHIPNIKRLIKGQEPRARFK